MPTDSTEGRTCRALRDAGAITGPQLDAAIATCRRPRHAPSCGGTGNSNPRGNRRAGPLLQHRPAERSAMKGVSDGS